MFYLYLQLSSTQLLLKYTYFLKTLQDEIRVKSADQELTMLCFFGTQTCTFLVFNLFLQVHAELVKCGSKTLGLTFIAYKWVLFDYFRVVVIVLHEN